jgi:hypothetical protein
MPGLQAPTNADSAGVQPYVDANHLGKSPIDPAAFSTNGGATGSTGGR